MRNTGITERDAVDYLRDILGQSELIRTEILENDKTPSWDGHIELYSDNSQRKDKLIGRCDVQVKGQECKNVRDLQQNEITYRRIQIADLKNYAHEGGILYFVVHIYREKECGRRERKIYYASLLAYDLEQLLNANKNKTTTITLYALPTNIKDIERIIAEHLLHRSKQMILLQGLLNSESFINEPGEFRLFGINPPHLLDKKSKYLYKTLSKGIVVPVAKITIEEAAIRNYPVPVCINEKQYFSHATFSFKRPRIASRIILNHGLQLLVKESGNKANIEFKSNCTLDEYIQNLQFMVALKKEKSFSIGNIARVKNFIIDDTENRLEKFLDLFTKIKALLDYLHVDKKVKVDKLTENMIDQLLQLHKCIILYEDYLPKKVEKNKKTHLVNLHIGPYAFKLLQISKDDGKISFINPFDSKLKFAISIDGKNRIQASIAFWLTEEDLIEIDNIDYEGIYQSLVKVKYNDVIEEETNHLCLRFLRAYDKMGNKPMLECASKLTQWLWKNNPITPFRLNTLQIIARQRELTKEEKEELTEIQLQGSDLEIAAGAAILLQNKDSYVYYLKRMTSQQRHVFLQYPIANLMKV